MTPGSLASSPPNGSRAATESDALSRPARLRVAIIDEELPYPLTSGKRIRTVGLLRHLASRHEITYICHRNQELAEAREAEQFFERLGIAVRLVDRPVQPSTSRGSLRLYMRLAMNLISRLPYSVQAHTSRKLRAAIVQHGREHAVDLWHCEWSPCTESLDLRSARPCVAVAHNVESLIWQRYVETEPHRLRRWYISRQWSKFRRFERRIFGQLDRLITVSDADKRLAVDDFAARSCAVVDNGVDVEYFSRTSRRPSGERILFLGSLDWRPNQDAVRWLLEEIFPALVQQLPRAELDVVGRRPPPWLQALAARTPGVRLFADVPDVRPFMAESSVMAIPLRVGGGTRLKLLESAAAGLPVVSTTIGAEGLSLRPAEHFLQADRVDDLVAALAQALAQPTEMAAMAERARSHVVEHYDWAQLAAKLERVWFECVGEFRATPAQPPRAACALDRAAR